MTKTAEPPKGELKLSWSDRLDLIKNNRIVAAITPFALLAVIYIIFVPLVSVNGGDFLKASVVQGIVNQGIPSSASTPASGWKTSPTTARGTTSSALPVRTIRGIRHKNTSTGRRASSTRSRSPTI